MSIDFSSCVDSSGNVKPLSECPDGVSGYQLKTPDQHYNECADAGVTVEEGESWIKKIFDLWDGLFSLPEAIEDVSFLDWDSQKQIGQCHGAATSNISEGCTYLQTGEKIQFSYFANYVRYQHKGGNFGRDSGSIPSAGYKVMQQDGMVPESMTVRQADLFGCGDLVPNEVRDQGEDTVWQITPKTPTTYREGLGKFNNGRTVQIWEDLASFFKIGSIVELKSYEQIADWLRTRQGFVNFCSKWLKPFDEHKTHVRSFYGRAHNAKHSSGHSYAIAGLSPEKQNGKNCGILWNSWGDDYGISGGKIWLPTAIDETFGDSMTIATGISKMSIHNAKVRDLTWVMG